APALDPTRARQRACVGVGSGDRGHAARKAGDLDGRESVAPGAVADSPARVEAPALDPTRARQRARLVTAGGDRGHAARKAGDADRGAPAAPGAVAELSVAVAAPTHDPTRGRQRARVLEPRGDCGHAVRKA